MKVIFIRKEGAYFSKETKEFLPSIEEGSRFKSLDEAQYYLKTLPLGTELMFCHFHDHRYSHKGLAYGTVKYEEITEKQFRCQHIWQNRAFVYGRKHKFSLNRQICLLCQFVRN